MRFEIEHTTEYQYTEAVRLDSHLIRLTPRPDARVSVARQHLDITPEPMLKLEEVDEEGNVVFKLAFDEPTTLLRIVNHLSLDTTAPIREPGPFYVKDLSPKYLVRTHPSTSIDTFSAAILKRAGGDVITFAHELNQAIYINMTQIVRESGDPYSPEETWSLKSGACRDYAVLMIDACRSVGVPARFVSGYQDGDIDVTHRYLHAWIDVYIDNLGWVGFDPTVGLATTESHVPLAAAANHSDTAPVVGSFWSYRASSQLTCSLALSAR